MTPRERLLAPFRGLRPDRPAWLADLSYWYSATQAAGRLDPRYQGDAGRKRLHEDLGVCCYYGHGASTYTTRSEGVEHEVRESGGRRVRRWRTPAGELAGQETRTGLYEPCRSQRSMAAAASRPL